MALPNPNPNQAQNQQQMPQYMAASIRESISTGFKAAGLQMGASIFGKSPILRTLGGRGLAESLELKKREMYERTGRDEQGRKLTKQEFEDREKRRKDLGALSEMLEIMQLWNDTGVPAVLKKDSDALFLVERIEAHLIQIARSLGAASGGMMMGTSQYGSNAGSDIGGVSNPDELGIPNLPPKDDTAELNMQEMAEEKEREDDQDQLESEGRQQGFFTKLFAGLKTGEKKEDKSLFGSLLSGILSGLSSLGGTIGSFFMKYLGGNALSSLWSSATGGKGVKGLLGAASRGIGRAASATGRFIMNTGAGKTIAKAGGELANIGRGALDLAGRAGTAVKDVAVGAAQRVGNVASSAGSAIANTASSIGSTIAEKAGSLMPKSGGLLSRAGGWLSSAWGSVSNAVSNLNPFKTLKTAVKQGSGKILKGLLSFPGLGAAIEAAMAAWDISSIKADPELTPDEKKEKIGTRVATGLGSIIGSIGGGALGSLLPIPGIGTILGTMGGAWVGEKLAELLAEAIGPKGIYDFMTSIPLVGKLFEVDNETATPDASQVQPSASEAATQEQIDQENQIRTEQGLPPLTPEEVQQRRTVGDLQASTETGTIAPISTSMEPPAPIGQETLPVSNANSAFKIMPEPVAQVTMPTATIQQTNNAVMASGLSARMSTGIDMSPMFQGTKPAFAF